MAEIAISGAIVALRKATNWLCNQVVEAGSRLFKLKQDVIWIENEMEYIQAYLKFFDDENDETSNMIEAALVKNVRLLAYDIEDVLESYLVKIASEERKGCLGWITNTKLILGKSNIALDFSLEIEEIKKRVEDISRVRQTYGILFHRKESVGLSRDARRSFPHTEEVYTVGMHDKVEELNIRLRKNDLRHLVVSITGTAGLGKTTLARKVYNSVRKDFNCSAWICVSQQPNIAELLRDISRQVGLDKEKWVHNTEFNLSEYLRNKRSIIVIDDLWKIRSWDGLQKGIPTNTENGSRIILTSRTRDIGEYVGGKSSVCELEPLNRVDSRKLFFNIINLNSHPENRKEASDNLSPSLLGIGEKILEKCQDIPLAIVLTASMLSLRDRVDYVWKGVLEGMDLEEDQCSQIFELSYKDLPSKLKPCFLYFGLFPEDHKIKASNLIKLWAAERFIEGSEIREVEEVGEDYLNQLVVRSLVQVSERKTNGRIKTCHIHDILHNLCVRVAKDINFFRNEKGIDTSSMIVTRVRRFANHNLNLTDYISLGHEIPKSRAFLWFSSDVEVCSKKDSKNLIWNLEFLRVLSLERGLYLKSLSRKIGNVIHLTYLHLKIAPGERVPSAIKNLKSLMTLDVEDCDQIIIPYCIWEMKCLRHLLLGRKCQIKYPAHMAVCNMNKFEVCGVNLRTLSMLYLPYKLNGPRKYLLPNLRKLGISFNEVNVTSIKMLLENATKLEVLKLDDAGESKPFDIRDLNLGLQENLTQLWIDASLKELTEDVKFPPNLTKLTLGSTYLRDDPMKILKNLPMLKFLRLDSCSYLGEMMLFRSWEDEGSKNGNFPQLEVLQIDLNRLLRRLEIEEPAMPQLKMLRLKSSINRSEIIVDAPQRIKDKIIRFVQFFLLYVCHKNLPFQSLSSKRASPLPFQFRHTV